MNDKSKEALVGVLKSGLAAIPYVGGLFNELCFDIRGRIVQKRVNDFTNSFIEYIKDLELNIDESIITSEIFNDVYISILKRVTETRCEYKLNIFKEILKSNILVPYESDFKETFLELVNKLDYMEIEILNIYKDTGRSGSMDIPKGAAGCISTTTSISCKEEITKRIKEKFPKLSTIEIEGRYEFYICDLISKSLLVDTKAIGNTWNDMGKQGLAMLYITDFGKEFLKFIQIKV